MKTRLPLLVALALGSTTLGSTGCSLEGLECVFEDIFDGVARGLAGEPVPNLQFVDPYEGTVGIVLACDTDPCVLEPDMLYPSTFFDAERDVRFGNRGALPFREIQSLDPLVATVLWAPDDEPEDGLSTEVDRCADAMMVANAPGTARFDFLDKKGRRIGRVEVEIVAPMSELPTE